MMNSSPRSPKKTMLPAHPQDFLEFDEENPSFDFFDIEKRKACNGLPLFVYYTCRPIEVDIQNHLHVFGELIFPLGKEFKVIKMEVVNAFTLSGLIGINEIKLLLKFNASHDIRFSFEKVLANYLETKINR